MKKKPKTPGVKRTGKKPSRRRNIKPLKQLSLFPEEQMRSLVKTPVTSLKMAETGKALKSP